VPGCFGSPSGRRAGRLQLLARRERGGGGAAVRWARALHSLHTHHTHHANVLLPAQLCELLRGRTDSCSFHSMCSDTFNLCAMGHLCAQDPAKSAPCRQLLPFIDRFLAGGRSEDAGQADMNGRAEDSSKTAAAAAAAAATEAAKLSMALAEERRGKLDELQAKLDERDEETQALLNKNAALSRALEDKQQHGKSLGASLVQSGVQMIPSSELDLDLTGKEVLGTGVYSGASCLHRGGRVDYGERRMLRMNSCLRCSLPHAICLILFPAWSAQRCTRRSARSR